MGKQSVKQLLRQDQGATNIEIEKTGIRNFKRILDKYGVDYAITKDYSAKLVNKEKRPSVLERLEQFKALAAELVPGKLWAAPAAARHASGSSPTFSKCTAPTF